MAELFEIFLAEVTARDPRTASAVKRGRNKDFPFVPIAILNEAEGIAQTQNIAKGLAYATRKEAVARAQRAIDSDRRSRAIKMTRPEFRALREQFGFPRELTDMEAGA